MCMQRVEFNIRQFPLSSFLSYTLFSLQLGRCHSITLAFFSAANPLIARTAALIRTIPPLSNITGALFRQGCSLALRLGGLGLFFNGCRHQGVILKRLLKRGNVEKVEPTGRRRKKGIGVDEGWRGSGSEKNGNAGSSCTGCAAALQAACHSDATPPLLDMSLAGRVSCSMLNCFVSVRAFLGDSFTLGLWTVTFVCSKAPPTHLPVCAREPVGGGMGQWVCWLTHVRAAGSGA